MTRREMLRRTGGAVLPLLSGGFTLFSSFSDPVEIKMRTSSDRTEVWFEPIGLAIEPGQTVRWVVEEGNAHNTKAYHPSNGNRPLRIPEGAEPWNSDTMYRPGASFEVTLTGKGVYDYFCEPHEEDGMAGRIVVGSPSGPGSRPFGYWKGSSDAKGWTEVPSAVQSTLPSPEKIVKEGRVSRSDI